jgi:hypothetical protein
MNFIDWVNLRMESEAAKSLNNTIPLSKAGFVDSNKLPHKEYQPKNFDRYSFKASEEKTKEYTEQMKKAIFHNVLLGSEALAGFYGNDEIIKALDDYLTRLSQLGIKL